MKKGIYRKVGEISIDEPIKLSDKIIMEKTNLRKKRENLKESINVKKMQTHFYELLKLMLKIGGKIDEFNKTYKKENINPENVLGKELISKIRDIRIFIKSIGRFEKLSTKEQAEVTLKIRERAEELMKYLEKDKN